MAIFGQIVAKLYNKNVIFEPILIGTISVE